jgi:RHS repeat-associated protein
MARWGAARWGVLVGLLAGAVAVDAAGGRVTATTESAGPASEGVGGLAGSGGGVVVSDPVVRAPLAVGALVEPVEPVPVVPAVAVLGVSSDVAERSGGDGLGDGLVRVGDGPVSAELVLLDPAAAGDVAVSPGGDGVDAEAAPSTGSSMPEAKVGADEGEDAAAEDSASPSESSSTLPSESSSGVAGSSSSTLVESSGDDVVPVVEVGVVSDAAAAGAGLEKVGLTVSALPAGAAVGELVGGLGVRIVVDYTAFVAEFGADWAGRLRLLRFDRCWLVQLGGRGCGAPVVAEGFVNDRAAGTVSLVVALDELVGGGGAAGEYRAGFATGGPGFGLSAGAYSATGNYATSSLNPAGEWSVGTQSGSFEWSYPVGLPVSPAGPVPEVAASYSSAAIDGLTAAENTQGGVLGPGWSLGEAFIERGYRTCAYDGGVIGDLCWVSNNATLSLNGVSSRLVRVGTETAPANWEAVVWKLEADNGWRVKTFRRTNAATVRGGFGVDNDGEYWVVVTPDGVEYYFGYGAETGDHSPGGVLGSVQTVPVVGNHAGEPCNTQSYNWCHQGYRWNLDRIVDANGRAATLFYQQHGNWYGRHGNPSTPERYVAAAVLARIEYGQVASNAATAGTNTHQVTFAYTFRCNNPDTNGLCTVSPTTSNGSNFPDVPNDQLCGSTTTYCTKYAPTFFQRHRLVSITTQARNHTGALVDVGRDSFGVEWVDTDGAGSDPARLWLRTIQHTGLAGGSATLPAIRFDGVALANRVDYNLAGGVTQMKYYRVNSVIDVTGQQVAVTYTQPKPCPSPWPSSPPSGWTAWSANTWACFPRWWAPPSGPAGFTIWHKYVVDTVEVRDLSGAVKAPTLVTNYDYPDASGSNGGMGWHSDSNELVPVGQRSWGEFRGFERVRVTTGAAADPRRQVTDYVFHRGLHDDINSHTNPATPKDVHTTPSSLGTASDLNSLAGRPREVIVTNASGADVFDAVVTDYVTYQSAGSGNPATAWQVEASQERTRASYGGAARYGRVHYSYDSHAWFRRPTTVLDRGKVDAGYNDVAGDHGAADHRCHTTSYTPASALTGRFLLGLPHRHTLSPSTDCVSWLLADTRTYYDAASPTAVNPNSPPTPAAPTWGNPTHVWQATGTGVVDDTGSAVAGVVDYTSYETGQGIGWARPSSHRDARGQATTIAYTSFAGGSGLGSAGNHATKTVTTTNPAGHTTSSEFDIYGRDVAATDPNARTTYACYDPLGRVTKVYEPGTPGGDTCSADASVTYQYHHASVAPNETAPVANVARWSIRTGALFATATDPFRPQGAVTATSMESWQLLDGLGRVAQTNTASPAGGRIVTRNYYDTRGNLIRQTDPFWDPAAAGTTWNTSANASIPTATVHYYDPVGRVITTQTLDNNIAIRDTTTARRPDTITRNPTTATGETSPYAATVEHLDAHGNVWKIVENANAGANTATVYTHDQADRLTTITDPAGNVTTLTYNQLGWRTGLDDPNHGYSTVSYYRSGQPRITGDAANTNILHTIDTLGRVTATYHGATVNPANQLSGYLYDTLTGGVGATVQADAYDPPGTLATQATITAIDAAGRISGHAITIPAADNPADPADNALVGPHHITTTYTRNGQIATTTHPGITGANLPTPETVTTRYNTLGLPIEVESPLAPGGAYTSAINYDNLARPTTTHLGVTGTGGAGLILTRDYQPADGRLARLRAHTPTGQVIQDDHYTYDAPGNPTRITRTTSWDTETECFDYDTRQRLSRAYTLTANPNCPTPGSAVTPTGPAPYLNTYTYDNLHRITNHDGTTRTHGATTPSGCRTNTDPTKPHALTGHGTQTLTYNCNGAALTRTQSGVTTTYTWTPTQRLATVTTNTQTTRHTYDTTGTRTLRIDPDGTRTIYLANTEARYQPGQQIRVARTYTTNTRRDFNNQLINFATDHQQSITATANHTTPTTNRTRYQPYGPLRTTLTNTLTNLDDRNYLNQPHDPHTNLNYLNQRHYAADLATFISVDPLAFPDNPASLNPYGYGLGNPITLSDPSGLCAGIRYDGTFCSTSPRTQPAPAWIPNAGKPGFCTGGCGVKPRPTPASSTPQGPPASNSTQDERNPNRTSRPAPRRPSGPPTCSATASSYGPSTDSFPCGNSTFRFTKFLQTLGEMGQNAGRFVFDPESCEQLLTGSCGLEAVGLLPIGKLAKLTKFLNRGRDAARVATNAGSRLLSPSSLADEIANATGGVVKTNKGGFTVNVPNGSRGITIRVMEEGGGRTNYYRVSVPGKGTYTVAGQTSTDAALTHIPIGQSSMDDILAVVERIQAGG